MSLKAVYPILYKSTQFKVGDSLPANDPDMVKAWLEAGTAVWEGEQQEEPTTETPAPAQAETPAEQPAEEQLADVTPTAETPAEQPAEQPTEAQKAPAKNKATTK